MYNHLMKLVYHIHVLGQLPADNSTPPTTPPSGGAPKIAIPTSSGNGILAPLTAPFENIAGSIWGIVLRIILPAALAISAGIWISSGAFGSKTGVARGRSGIFTVLSVIVSVIVVVFFGNLLLSSFS